MLQFTFLFRTDAHRLLEFDIDPGKSPRQSVAAAPMDDPEYGDLAAIFSGILHLLSIVEAYSLLMGACINFTQAPLKQPFPKQVGALSTYLQRTIPNHI